jgi:peptide subunit release factor 1 (eRF1)
MITREELRQLAQFESSEGCAISFYFQPQTPQDKSHRDEAILVKDLVRDTLRRSERNGNRQGIREDLQRILAASESLHGNHSRGKAIFACNEHGLWRELDLPPRLGRSQIIVNSRFHLKPLVAAFAEAPRACIALLDREKARIFELQGEILTQKPEVEFGRMPRVGRSDGFEGYEGGHRERHVENEVMNRFKLFAESVHILMNRDRFETLLIGCRDEAWPEIEPHLSSYVKQRLAGHFLVDPSFASGAEVHQAAKAMLEQDRNSEQQSLVREVIGQAARNGRGAVGLRRVLTALERQEVQVLVVGRDFQAEAVECRNCGHLDTRMVKSCAVCGQATRELTDVADALVDLALRNGAEIQFVHNDPELEKAGRIGALLRFRGDQNTAEKIAV